MAEVTKNVDEQRFEIWVDGELAGTVDYVVEGGGVVTLPHTNVQQRFEGRGLASELVRFALDDIRAEGYLVNPVCPYVRGWIGKHPDYAELVREIEARAGSSDAADSEVAGLDQEHDPRI